MMIVTLMRSMIGLSLSCLNFESTNWIFGNKIRIYQLLTMHRAKKGLVITKHYSFDTDLHHVTSRILDPTDVIFLTLDLLGDHQWPSSFTFAACGLSWQLNSCIRLHNSIFFFFYDVFLLFPSSSLNQMIFLYLLPTLLIQKEV